MRCPIPPLSEAENKRQEALETHAKRLETANSVFFAVGAVLARLHPLIQIPLITLILSPMAMGFYFIGHLLWLIETHLNPDVNTTLVHPAKPAPLKETFTASAMLGLAGAIVGMVSILTPILLMPTAILFTLSNLFWCIGEYQRMKQMKETSTLLKQQTQAIYFHYACIVTAISALTTIFTITIFCFPPFTFIAMMITPLFAGIICAEWIRIKFFNTPIETVTDRTRPSTPMVEKEALLPVPDPESTPPLPSVSVSPLASVDIGAPSIPHPSVSVSVSVGTQTDDVLSPSV